MTGIIDAHTHIWERASGDYTWLTSEHGVIYDDFGLEDFAPVREAAGVDQVILVQAADTPGDTDRMLAAAAAHPEVVGVVAWLPLAGADLREQLDARLATGRVVGVRALIHGMADGEWMLRPDVAAGLEVLAAADVPFDFVTSGPAALALVPRLMHRHPSLRLVIDHLGKPPVGGDASQFEEWSRLLRGAAASPRVAAKLSGLASAVGAPDGWTVDDLRPIVGEAVAAFGPDRLMYGGDWPVSNLAGGYRRTFEGLHAALDVSQRDLERIHRGTAVEWYGLESREASA